MADGACFKPASKHGPKTEKHCYVLKIMVIIYVIQKKTDMQNKRL